MATTGKTFSSLKKCTSIDQSSNYTSETCKNLLQTWRNPGNSISSQQSKRRKRPLPVALLQTMEWESIPIWQKRCMANSQWVSSYLQWDLSTASILKRPTYPKSDCVPWMLTNTHTTSWYCWSNRRVGNQRSRRSTSFCLPIQQQLSNQKVSSSFSLCELWSTKNWD